MVSIFGQREARIWEKKRKKRTCISHDISPIQCVCWLLLSLLISCRLFVMELRQVHAHNHNDNSIIATMSNLRWLHILLSSFGYLKCCTNELSQLPSLYICIRLWALLCSRIASAVPFFVLASSATCIRSLCTTKKYDRAAQKVW